MQKIIDLHCDTIGDIQAGTDLEKDHWQDAKKTQMAMSDLGTELNMRMADIHVGIDSVTDHIAHIVNLVGDDFVGFGSDFDGLPALPEEMSGCDIFPSIIANLQNRGFLGNRLKKSAHKTLSAF